MTLFRIFVVALILVATGCASTHKAIYPNVKEAEIRHVLQRIRQLKPGMTKAQVWKVLGKLPLEDKVLWVSAGSDWGEGNDTYLLKHGYLIRLLWDTTNDNNWKYRRTWFWREGGERIEL